MPAVDAAYRTARSPDARAILGTSLGGLHAAYVGLTHAGTFGLIAIQSPYFRIRPAVVDGYAQHDRLPLKLFMNQGAFDFDVANTRRLQGILQTVGYPLMYLETNDGHSWGNWRGLLDDMLVYFFGR